MYVYSKQGERYMRVPLFFVHLSFVFSRSFLFFLRTAMCISSLCNIDCHEFTFFWGEQMELVTSCQRKTMCCVFKVPKGLLHFQTKSIHCVGNVLSVNLSAWFINFSFAEMQRYFSLCKWNKISLEISNVKRVWFMKVKFSKHTIEVHHSMQNLSSANLSMPSHISSIK